MFIFPGGKAQSYQIANSLRFRASASAYLSRTFSSAGSTTWTYSIWTKRGRLGTSQVYLNSGATAGNNALFHNATDQLSATTSIGGAAFTSTAVYRDPSAFQHIVFSSNAGTITAYVNNASVGTGAGSNTINSNVTHYIGAGSGSNYFLDGLLSEINFIDGQALTPSSFGETNADGVWVPKRYTGTYGANGFYLPFNDGTSATTLGYDRSGNANNWTPSGISTTAGVTYDWMTDTPTNNYCALNPIDKASTVTNGNLTTSSGAAHQGVRSSVFVPSGLFYAEATLLTTTSATILGGIGLANSSASLTSSMASAANYWGVYFGDQRYINRNGTNALVGSTTAAGSTIQIAVDRNNNQAWVGVNNVWYDGSNGTTGAPSSLANPTFTSLPADLVMVFQTYQQTLDINFGQRPFTYTPPTGFKALCTANLPAVSIPNPRKHFDAIPYVGNGGTKAVTGAAFQPDFVWLKSRGQAYGNVLGDAVRGVGKILYTNATNAEDTGAYIASFDASGFTVNITPGVAVNQTSDNIISWLWKANGAGVSNTAGSITSTVSANTTAGFSIVTYTGTGANATVGHGLGKVPSLIINKNRSIANGWRVWHSALTLGNTIYLNATNAQTAESIAWNSTAPTSTVFSVGASGDTNGNTNLEVCYCFAEIAGFSKFGSYTGNGSTDGPYVHCGFRPRYLLVKSASGTAGSWIIYDGVRQSYNVIGPYLLANTADIEGSVALIDFTANGFKLRTASTDMNLNSSCTYIYAAFAEFPNGSNVAPSPAR